MLHRMGQQLPDCYITYRAGNYECQYVAQLPFGYHALLNSPRFSCEQHRPPSVRSPWLGHNLLTLPGELDGHDLCSRFCSERFHHWFNCISYLAA